MQEIICRRCGQALGLAQDWSPSEAECFPACGRAERGTIYLVPPPRWPGSLLTPAYE